MDLDEPRRFAEVDPYDALGQVEGTAVQWDEARAFAGPPVDLDGLDGILVTGMGGSGITGDLVAVLAPDHLDVPVLAQKGYELPGWASNRTLVVAVSYSGETEETLSVAQQAVARGCRVLTISGGGTLDQLAAEHGLGRVTVPDGGMPRYRLGRLVVPALAALGIDAGLDEATELQSVLAAAWGRDVPTVANPVKRLAERIAAGGLVVACGNTGLPAVAAWRLKCQLNENAKLPAFAAVLPELCHNEVCGWHGDSTLARAAGIVWLRDPASEHPQVRRRIAVTDTLVAEWVGWTTQVTAYGDHALARIASLLLFADLASVYTAIALDRDPTSITSIETLKRALAALTDHAGSTSANNPRGVRILE